MKFSLCVAQETLCSVKCHTMNWRDTLVCVEFDTSHPHADITYDLH